MSHTTTINSVVFVDIHAVSAALAELNSSGVRCSLIQGGTPRAYYPNQSGLGPADYVIHLTDCAYDVGLYFNAAKKGYEARADLFANRVGSILGSTAPMRPSESYEQTQMGKLFQLYAVHATIRKAAQQGMTARRINKEDGSIRVVVGAVA